jgi:spore maturation protein CgeB
MRIAFYGSSLLSSYWNGAATYYRGILAALAPHGYDITFYEPDAFGRGEHRDIALPDYARAVVYPADAPGLASAIEGAATADIVIKASGVGVFDDELLAGMMHAASPDALRIFWDVDAPATLAELAASPDHPLRRALPKLDLVLCYGGGAPVVSAYEAMGARLCVAVYNALDPRAHHPVPRQPEYQGDLVFMGNRLPDREARIGEFFLKPASILPSRRFLLGGSGWDDKPMTPNINRLGHVPTAAHNAVNASALAVLNIARDSMASTGFSPATRVFEAAGAGACLITDAWEGIELFLQPGAEVLVARDGQDVAAHLVALTPDQACRIGQAALARVLCDHTYEKRAILLDQVLRDAFARKQEMRAA